MVTKCGDEAVPAPFLNPPCVHPLLTATLPDPFSSRISLYKVGSISSHEKTERRRDHFCCRLGLASRGTRRLSRPGLWGVMLPCASAWRSCSMPTPPARSSKNRRRLYSLILCKFPHPSPSGPG